MLTILKFNFLNVNRYLHLVAILSCFIFIDNFNKIKAFCKTMKIENQRECV